MLQDYQVLIAFTSPVNSAALQVGDILTIESNLGEKLCRCGNLKNITAHVNTDVEVSIHAPARGATC